MDIIYNENYLLNIEDINRYVIIDDFSYRWILTNIKYNYLMILFTMSCVSTLVCCYKKSKNEYILVQDSKPVNGSIVDEGINKV